MRKLGGVLSGFCDRWGIEPRYQRQALLALWILGIIHLGGCAVWFVKVFTSDLGDVLDFLEEHRPFASGSPADLATPQGKVATYLTCAYFVTTVFSTVGFGDITATNSYERIMYSALMLSGILVFGNLMSELAEINRAARVSELETMERVHAAMQFMSGHEIPRHLSDQVLDISH